MSGQLGLRHGSVYDIEDGWRVAVWFVSNPERDGRPLSVELAVADPSGAEQAVTVGVGDRFPIGAATWQLAGVDDVDSYDYTVRLIREGEKA